MTDSRPELTAVERTAGFVRLIIDNLRSPWGDARRGFAHAYGLTSWETVADDAIAFRLPEDDPRVERIAHDAWLGRIAGFARLRGEPTPAGALAGGGVAGPEGTAARSGASPSRWREFSWRLGVSVGAPVLLGLALVARDVVVTGRAAPTALANEGEPAVAGRSIATAPAEKAAGLTSANPADGASLPSAGTPAGDHAAAPPATRAPAPARVAREEPDWTFGRLLAAAPGASGVDSTARYSDLRRALRARLGKTVVLVGRWESVGATAVFAVGGERLRVTGGGDMLERIAPGEQGYLAGRLAAEAPWQEMRFGADRWVGEIEMLDRGGWTPEGAGGC